MVTVQQVININNLKRNKMKDFVSRMIQEHADLLIKIEKLENVVYTDKFELPKPEYANCAIQLKAMKNYAEALLARLNNHNITFSNGVYSEAVAVIHNGDCKTCPSPCDCVCTEQEKDKNEDE